MRTYFATGHVLIQLMRWDKPVGIWLLLWPTLCALWIAGNGHPQLHIVLIFVCGTVVMRSAGCVINDLADRHIDGHVSRTHKRPLATQALSPKHAIVLLAILCMLSGILVLQLNRLTQEIALIALSLAGIYPFTKRWFPCPQCILGLAFASAVPMAFAAQTNSLPPVCWLVFAIAVIWPIAYDTLYAMVDREDDRKLDLHSTALWWGHYTHYWVWTLYVILYTLLLLLAWLSHWGTPFILAWLLSAILLIYNLPPIKAPTRQNYFSAFRCNQWLGLIWFIGILLS